MRDAPQINGIAINGDGHILLQTPAGTFVLGLSPEELRSFSAALVETADKMEAEAAQAASAAISRAGGLQ